MRSFKEGVVKKKVLFVALGAALLTGIIVFAVTALRKPPLALPKGEGLLPASAGAAATQAKKAEEGGNYQQAKEIYQALEEESPNSKEVLSWQKNVEGLNIKLLFSPAITQNSESYEIQPYDSLAKIAKHFNTTVDLIKKSNNISGDTIYPGRKIKVWTAPFSIFVDKSQNTLLLESGGELVKTYIVSTGTNNSTPTGKFKIVNKLENPTWFKAGTQVPAGSPDNILGTRWMGFDLGGYGIHGTTDPASLGRQVTQGCVRMANQDAEELYIIVPAGTEVTIVD